MGVRVGQPLVPRSGGGAASPLQIEADTASLYRALPANDKQTVGFCFSFYFIYTAIILIVVGTAAHLSRLFDTVFPKRSNDAEKPDDRPGGVGAL